MVKLTPLCFAAALLLQLPVAAVHAQAVAAPVDQSLSAQIDAAVAPYYQADGPGASVIVTKDGKTLLRKAYGMADVAGKVAMRPEHSLRLGSITKQFTATGIMLLVDEGKLSLSDPLTKYFPDFQAHAGGVTIEHLLTHTSGIVSYTSKKDFGATVARDMTVTQMIDTFKNDPLEFAPGTRYAYNNSGYFLLGALIEKISGQSYAKFMEQRIFVPLGMTQTAYEGHERVAPLRAVGHSRGETGFTPSTPMSMTQPYAAGALVSNVDDLARWDAAVASGKLLKKASWAKVHTAYKLADGKPITYGYGWHVQTLRGSPVFAHGGSIKGASTHALRLPNENVFVAILVNADSGIPQTSMVANKAAAIAMGKPYPVRTAITVDAAALDGMTGVYKINDSVTRTVRRDKGNLVMDRGGRNPVPLYPFAANEFFVPDATVTIRFVRNDKGVIDRLVFVDEGRETVNERVGNVPTAGSTAPPPI